MNSFQESVLGKKVALIGNASSIFDYENGGKIAECDVVIRMNAGFIKKPDSQGQKTDILALSLALKVGDIINEFDPQLVIWATSKRKFLPQEYKNQKNFKLVLHPFLVWFKLRIKLNARPSTGAIIANYLTKCCNPIKIELYGFDFFKTKTFYNEKHHIGPHAPSKEEVFFNELIFSGKIQNMQANI
jgi:hypothetical protein